MPSQNMVLEQKTNRKLPTDFWCYTANYMTALSEVRVCVCVCVCVYVCVCVCVCV